MVERVAPNESRAAPPLYTQQHTRHDGGMTPRSTRPGTGTGTGAGAGPTPEPAPVVVALPDSSGVDDLRPAGEDWPAGIELAPCGAVLDAALASGSIDTLRSLLANNTDSIATALSAPVQVQREALYPVTSFGSAMICA